MHAEQFPVAIIVDAGGQQHAGFDHAPAFADFHRQRVARDREIRTCIQRAGAKVLHHPVELFGHVTDLRFRQVGDTAGGDEIIHPAGGDSLQVAGGDHGGQGALCTGASIQQPVGEERTGPVQHHRWCRRWCRVDMCDRPLRRLVRVSLTVAYATPQTLRAWADRIWLMKS